MVLPTRSESAVRYKLVVHSLSYVFTCFLNNPNDFSLSGRAGKEETYTSYGDVNTSRLDQQRTKTVGRALIAGDEVLTAADMNIAVIWEMRPCSLAARGKAGMLPSNGDHLLITYFC